MIYWQICVRERDYWPVESKNCHVHCVIFVYPPPPCPVLKKGHSMKITHQYIYLFSLYLDWNFLANTNLYIFELNLFGKYEYDWYLQIWIWIQIYIVTKPQQIFISILKISIYDFWLKESFTNSKDNIFYLIGFQRILIQFSLDFHVLDQYKYKYIWDENKVQKHMFGLTKKEEYNYEY